MIALPTLEPRTVPIVCGLPMAASDTPGCDVEVHCGVNLVRFGPALVCRHHGTVDYSPREPLAGGAIVCGRREVLGR